MSERELPKEITNFISHVTAHFVGEAQRLHDPSVLLESRDLLQAYFKCLKQLGTIEHEVALDSIKRQMQIVRRYASKSRSLLWRRFRKIVTEKTAPADPLLADGIRSLRKFGDQTPDDHASRIDLPKLIEQAEVVEASYRRLEANRVEIEADLFQFEAGTHFSVYTRLTLQRTLSFMGKHTIIVLGSVVGLGLGYSWLARQGQGLIARIYPPAVWAALSVPFVAALLKEYVFSRQFKAIRLRAERWLLIPVLGYLLQARLLGLMSVTSDRK